MSNISQPPEQLDAPHAVEAGQRNDKKTNSSEVLTKPTKPRPASEWGPVQSLESALLPVLPLDVELLPAPLRPWIIDTVERMCCPLEYMVASAMASLGATIGRRVQIRPRQYDDWTVTPNVWGAIIGDSASLKSSPSQEGIRHLERLEALARKQFDTELAAHHAEQVVRKAERKKVENEIKDAIGDSKSTDILKSRLTKLIAEDCDIHLPRYVVHDATTEAIGILTAYNPMGLMLYRDELSGWLAGLHKQGREGDRQFYLEAWNGNKSFSYERVTRNSIYIPALCISICGTIQPEPFFAVIRDAAQNDGAGDGLVQRFQLLFYPDPPNRWERVDRRPDFEARERAFDVFKRIDDCNLQPEKDCERPALRFSLDAQQCFDAWEDRHRNQVLKSHDHPALRAHMGKYPKVIAALALMSHLAEWATDSTQKPGPVELQHCERAVRWADVLETHARRIYQRALGTNVKGACTIAARIRDGALQDGFTVRYVARKGWSGIGQSQERAQDALDYLESRQWVRGKDVQPGRSGGRPTRRYSVNPAARR